MPTNMNKPAAHSWRAASDHPAQVIDEGLRQHMLRVYNYMALGIAVTGLIAFLVGTTPALYTPMFSTPLKWGVILAPLPFALFFAFRIHSISAFAGQALFWTFCAVMGLSLGSIFLIFTESSIGRAFFAAAAMFGATSLYGYTTHRNLSSVGSFLFMGLIGVVIASVINLFLGSTALQFFISVVGIIVFVGLTAWDTQTMKEQYADNFDRQSKQKLAVLGAFSLYLNLLNIFQLLLNFFGERRE
jgi:uncharacterized protein